MPRPKKYPDELVQRGIRLALESERPIAHIAADLGMHPETLRKKVRQHEADAGKRPELPTSAEREKIRRLRQEHYELRRANEILKSASAFFRQGARPRPTEVTAFVDEYRGRFGSSRSAGPWACRHWFASEQLFAYSSLELQLVKHQPAALDARRPAAPGVRANGTQGARC